MIGHLSRALANMVDPLQSAHVLASALGPDYDAIALVATGARVQLRGEPQLALVDAAATAWQLLGCGRAAAAFL